MTDPAVPPAPAAPAPPPPTTPTTPRSYEPGVTLPPDLAPVEAQIADLQLQEGTVRQLLALLDDAAATTRQGAPDLPDLEAFGGSARGLRMARHAAGARERVHEALSMAMEALGRHQVSLAVFRDELVRVEGEAAGQLAALLSRVDATDGEQGRVR